MKFTKMHAAGNDFVVIDLRDEPSPSPATCAMFANRSIGIGCDLILGVDQAREEHSVASYRIWTAKGETSPQCGNGARCIGAWVLRAGLASSPSFKLDSPVGTHSFDLQADGKYRLVLTEPTFDSTTIGISTPPSTDGTYRASVTLRGVTMDIQFEAVSVGNPHVVIEHSDLTSAPVAELGRLISAMPILPKTVNVNFFQVLSRREIVLRVYEYGAGETTSCGTGAVATSALLMYRNRLDRSVLVHMAGGTLGVEWAGIGTEASLIGDANFVFDGRICE